MSDGVWVVALNQMTVMYFLSGNAVTMTTRGRFHIEISLNLARSDDSRTSWSYHSLNAIVVQLKNCPFWVNSTIELKPMTTDNSNKQKIQLNPILSKQFNNIKWRYTCNYIFFCSFLRHIFFELCHDCIHWSIWVLVKVVFWTCLL